MKEMKFLFRPVQRMRSILAILALFVCTSICLGDDPVIVTQHMGDVAYYEYTANANVTGMHPGMLHVGPNMWKLPVDCTLDIVRIDDKLMKLDSRYARISFACGAYMCNNDRNIYSNGSVSGVIQGPMTGNKVNVDTGWFNKSTIAGAYSYDVSAKVDNNGVSIARIQQVQQVQQINIACVYGGRAFDTSASSNTVTIRNMSIGNDASTGCVIGGYVQKGGLASNNEVIFNGPFSVRGYVCGGYIGENGTATLNTVTIGGVNVSSDVYGAKIRDGYASSNTVAIIKALDRGTVSGDVFGGYIVNNGTAILNEVELTSVTVTKGVYGAKIGNGLARDNKVKIEGGKIEGDVYGGYIHQNGTVTINTVTLTGVTVSGNVYGARIGNGLARDNRVTIKGGKIVGVSFFTGSVYGGYIDQKGTATLNEVNLTSVTVTNDVCGAWIGSGLASSNTVTITGGKIIGGGLVAGCVYGGYICNNGTATLNKVNLTSITGNSDVYGAYIRCGLATDYGLASSNTVTITSGAVWNVYGGRIVGDGTASSNTVKIISGTVGRNVFGGYIDQKGTATINKVNLTGVTVTENVYGAWIRNGYASSNTVTIISGTVKNVYGGYIDGQGTATLNEVHLTSVTVTNDVCGAKIEKFAFGINYGLASSNTVTIIGGKIGGSVFGGHTTSTGTASSNTVTINGGKTGGNVFGGYVGGKGKAIYNTITITGSSEQSSPEFSTATILCGGICANKATADASTNDAFTGNTLNIVETKGVVVNGISNFENYNFHLKDIKPGEVILTATSGGCSWDVVKVGSTTACTVDLSRSNIHLRTQSVLNKGEYCTLIRSPQGFKDNGAHKKFSFDNGGLVEYSWEIRVADNEQDLIATLNRKELREGKAKPLLEGNVTGMVCINNGMDCIISKMEETESLLGEGAKLQRKGEIGAFYGLLANKSSYDDTGSHIDMTGMSMMGGIGIGWKGLVTGAFGEYGTGNSDIDSGSCSCEKKSEGKSNYVGGGLLGRYNVCEDEFRGTKLYLEAILRAGEVSNTFNIKEAKDGAEKECKYNDETTMYGGCALGGGYKHKVGEKMDVDWSLRYMFGYQDGKDVEKPVDVYGNRVKLESVTSSRIRVGVRGKYVELEKVKPYIGIWYEHELSGKVKGAIQNGVDNVGDIPATSFEGGTGIGELGISWKVGKLDVGISGQGYLGVRKGFGGMLKLKYAFGKDAHAKPLKMD